MLNACTVNIRYTEIHALITCQENMRNTSSSKHIPFLVMLNKEIKW